MKRLKCSFGGSGGSLRFGVAQPYVICYGTCNRANDFYSRRLIHLRIAVTDAEKDALANQIAQKIGDYRSGDIPPTTSANVKAWLDQFDEPDSRWPADANRFKRNRYCVGSLALTRRARRRHAAVDAGARRTHRRSACS